MENNNEKSGNSSTITSASKKGKNKTSGSSNNNSDKPKQPQRGLGVAQLEKIRLHKQLASCGGLLPHHQAFLDPPFQYVPEEMMRYQLGYQEGLQTAALAPPPPPLLPPPFSYPPPSVPPSYDYHYRPNNVTMGMGDHHMERGYAESQFLHAARWNPNNEMVIQEYHPYTHQPGMVTRHLLGRVENRESTINHDLGSANNQNAESSGNDELDLELKL